MNDNYLNSYIDKNGNLIHRKKISIIRISIFTCFKFLFDELLSITLLIILLPLFIIIGITIKIDSEGPVFFKQNRTGKKGKIFTIYKFRTMVDENNLYDYSKKDIYTKFGKILRKTSLDELPQLICILKGEMSFIGPRPWIVDYYYVMNDIQRKKYDIRPGLTGLAQCNGRNSLNIFDKINYDLEYIKNYSLIQDIKVLFRTIRELLSNKDIDDAKMIIKKELDDLAHQSSKKKKGIR